jgi:serine/threonine protein kinase
MSFEPPDLTGAILSQRYTLVKRIGFGGMGTVYATDGRGENGAPLAVKILNPECMDNIDIVKRFIDEGRAGQKLIHPNIIRVFDVAVAESGAPYIVMELLSGVPLNAYTSNGQRVPIVQACTVIQGILSALSVAHSLGIVHRDLKPENVFLAQEKGLFVVKLLDFGIAKVMDAAGGIGSRTKTGVLLGTPAYMSPEQIMSTKDVDARSDLFSVGVLAYEMLTGKPAFPAPTEYAKLSAVLGTTPAPMETIDPELIRLKGVVEKAMQKARDARFSSALEMSQALSLAMVQYADDSGAVRFSNLPAVPEGARQNFVLTPGGSLDVPLTFTPGPQQIPGVVISTGGTLSSRKSAESLPPPHHNSSSNEVAIEAVAPVTASSGVRPAIVAVLCILCTVIGLALGILLGRA